ncbi:hypothetical protein [uncultured Ruegeria sp.]|uniref:hypothetical protein n=1 Tax=uncultured Ruegeria sp. TaxID=259304 RepID=UPI0026174CD6|nr:hypothetical protein [uncultured Ruegeria sp.]
MNFSCYFNATAAVGADVDAIAEHLAKRKELVGELSHVIAAPVYLDQTGYF